VDGGYTNMGIFGLPLMMSYYTVFDHANLKFGFVPLVNCYETKPVLVAGDTPTRSYENFGQGYNYKSGACFIQNLI